VRVAVRLGLARFASAASLALLLPVALLAEEEGAHAEKVLGIPQWIWQLANLILFFAVLIYFVARPITEAFRNRQLEVERRLKEALERRAEAARFETEIQQRMQRLEGEVEEIRRQGLADGESARRALEERAKEEAERIRRESEEEIERRVAAAKAELRQVAAGLTAESAREILTREIKEDDRRRLLADSVSRLKEAR
jgi:F-type H+-transporting ATPase subunit b